MADFTVIHDGSVSLLRPNTSAAEAWVEENIGEDNGYQPYWPTVVIERNYLDDILYGLQDEGLVWERDRR